MWLEIKCEYNESITGVKLPCNVCVAFNIESKQVETLNGLGGPSPVHLYELYSSREESHCYRSRQTWECTCRLVPRSIVDQKGTKRDSKTNENDRAKMELAGFDPGLYNLETTALTTLPQLLYKQLNIMSFGGLENTNSALGSDPIIYCNS